MAHSPWDVDAHGIWPTRANRRVEGMAKEPMTSGKVHSLRGIEAVVESAVICRGVDHHEFALPLHSRCKGDVRIVKAFVRLEQ